MAVEITIQVLNMLGQKVLAIRPSPELQARVSELLYRNRGKGDLTPGRS